MTSIDETTAFRRASEGFVDRARKIGPEQWSGPTPCTEWDVRTLVNHVAGEYLWVPEMLAARPLRMSATVSTATCSGTIRYKR
jgi:uncharacterized protein (TIGR03083 family)